jgi:DNA polymerase-3 subunit alpha
MSWFPLLNYTHYSLLRGFSKPSELVSECKRRGYKACGIADYKSISGAVSFYSACKKNDIFPIIGCSFDDFSLFAKNKNGWYELIELVSSIKDEEVDAKLLQQAEKSDNLFKVSPSDETPESFYVHKEDAELHRILLCSNLKCVMAKAKSITKDTELQRFFDSDNFYLKDIKDHSNTLNRILNECEEYNILNNPMLPSFPCPNGQSEEEYLKKLARKGWSEKLAKKIKKGSREWEIYGERFNNEFEVIKEANLFGYFLIVSDIIRHVESRGWMAGPGRGSAAGCLISYLIGITQVDPVEFDLIFERFYNSGRNSDGNISLPDIDMDVPAGKRDDVIDYLRKTYGAERVSQMLTFGRLQGRSAIKEVLRVYQACGFSEMNEITKVIPDEAAISDQLSQMDDDERSIIRWALLNNPEDLRGYCFVNDNGELEGDYADMFEKAIKIEGTFKTQGKHAAGVVISAEPLHKVCPMATQKNAEEKIAGLEMSDLEALGHVKFDVLGLSTLDKVMKIKEILNES